MLKIFLCFTFSALAFFNSAHATEITVAGFAFAGDYKTAASRFPYSFKVYEKLGAKNSGNKSLSLSVLERTKGIKNPNLELRPAGNLVNLKSSDQALMVVLMLSAEQVSTEDFGSYYKTFVNLRGDTLIFDYKNQTVVRSYPVSVVLFDATPQKPTEENIRAFVEDLLLRDDNRGLISQFAKRLEAAKLPRPGTKTVQVRKAEVAPEALALMPEALRSNPKAVESMLADSFGSILSAKLGVPMLPNSIGHAVGGVMTLRLESGDDYKLKLGEGDYLFDLKLNKFAKLKTAEDKISTSFVYGAYANVRFYEPTLNTDYLNTDLKNGENAVIPQGQITNDDFPAYQDAIRGMFLKLADAMQNTDSKWAKTAASAKDISTQLENTRTTLETCK